MIHCNAMLVIYFQISITTLSFMIHCHIFPLHYDVGLETSSAMFIWLLCLSVCVVWVVLHCLQCIGEVVAIKSGSSCWWEIKKKKLAAAHLWCIAMHCDVKSSCQSFWQNQLLVRRGAGRGKGDCWIDPRPRNLRVRQPQCCPGAESDLSKDIECNQCDQGDYMQALWGNIWKHTLGKSQTNYSAGCQSTDIKKSLKQLKILKLSQMSTEKDIWMCSSNLVNYDLKLIFEAFQFYANF